MRVFRSISLMALALVAALSSIASAQEKKEDPAGNGPPQETREPAEKDPPLDPADLGMRINERVNVIGDSSLVGTLPGSAYFIERRELELQKQGFDDVGRMLRQVPGVVIQEEEGYGLRPNIGFRGSGTERSSKITLMEDGVLIAPAPYAAPSAYYFPVAGRMESVEVRKGSSQIKFGPRTNGGVLNLISKPVPSDLQLAADLAVGSERSRKVAATIGDAYGNFGWNFETYQMRTDGFKVLDFGGDTGFDIEDYVGKLRFHTSPASRVFQEVEVKLGYAEQLSNETYLGLTGEDFEGTPLRRYAASQLDNLAWEHEQYQVRHFLALPRGIDLTTIAYRNNFRRNWYKLDSIAGAGLASLFENELHYARELALARGADSAENELTVRANNRSYYSQGVQSTLGIRWKSQELELGFRLHRDQEDRFQHEDGYQMLSGRMLRTRAGSPGSQANRVSDADALALFVQDEIRLRRFRITPGLRLETIDFLRTDFTRDDPDRISPAPERRNSVDVLIPGIGLTFDWTPDVRLFGGIHRGFSPPGPGADEETRPEESVNYELGMRAAKRGFQTETVFFYNDYRNLLGADTLSSGGRGEGDLFNGGAARALGLELVASANLAELFGARRSLPVRISYTLTDAVFQNAFESDFEPWGSVEAGDGLPYLPRHQLYGSAVLEEGRWLAGASAVYTSRMRTRAGRGALRDSESTDAPLVWNLFGEYEFVPSARLFVNVQNLTDESYIVARAPAGARPGLPRTLMAGIKFRLGS